MSANPVWLIDKFCTMPNHWSDWTSSLAMQFLNWVRCVSSARFQRSLSLYSVWYDGGLARGEKAFVVRKKDGHPFQGWLSTCGPGVNKASCLAFRALQVWVWFSFPTMVSLCLNIRSRGQEEGWGKTQAALQNALQASNPPVFSRAFPKHLRLPVSTLPTSPVELSLVCSEVLKLLGEVLKGLKHASGRCPVSGHQLCGPALSQKMPHISRVVFLTARWHQYH